MGRAKERVLNEFTKNPRWVVAPFDMRAAIELSLFKDAPLSKAEKKQGVPTHAKIKFDRQIVAIGKVLRVSCIFSDDADVRAVGLTEGLAVLRVADIVLPDDTPGEFRLTAPGSEVRK